MRLPLIFDRRLLSARRVSFVAVLLAGATAVHCGSSNDSTFVGNGADGGSSSGASGSFPTGCDGPCGSDDGSSGNTGPRCGDRTLATTEGCDDGNITGGDGCSATCTVEPGYTCPTPGLACEAAKCGDGILAGVEECEFQPGAPVTGCSAECKIEPGFDCDPKTFTCAAVSCGDGKVQRGESCEDGNNLPFDGCFNCKKEPACTNGVCQGACGDGQRFAGEACDDGNTRSGDGCSATCQIETGFACTDVKGTPPATIDQPILLRDFIATGREAGGSTGHPDFNGLGGNGIVGIVLPDLDASGRMVLNCPGDNCDMNPGHVGGAPRPNISTKANFDEWYRPNDKNIASFVTVSLGRQPDGTYRWDSANAAQNGGKTWFDPIGTGGWIGAGKEQTATCTVEGGPRNVSFTSETHFWFEYQGGESFDFAGDDDTWIFVNGKLAVDLGGLHTPKAGSFTLAGVTDTTTGLGNGDGGASFVSDLSPSGTFNANLTRGGIYEVVMFQAERNQCGSNFKVTLKNFNSPKSTCISSCGDGVVASNELCDDGKNDGSYGGCNPGCKSRPARCGDGVVQADKGEQCDDANSNNDDGCTNGCKLSGVK